MGLRRDVDHARRCRGNQPIAQNRRQPKVAHVIECKSQFKSVERSAAIRKYRTGIVDQDVSPRGRVEQNVG